MTLKQGLAPRAAQLLLGVFFLMAASYKMWEPGVFVRLLAQLPAMEFTSPGIRRLLAGTLVGVEGYVGAALVFRFQVAFALRISILLCVGLALFVAPFYESLGGECGCVWRWIPITPSTGLGLIARNAGVASIGLALVQLREGTLVLGRTSPR